MTTYVSRLEEALTSLLNDEDVKSLPCYKLLSNKFGSIIPPQQQQKPPKLVKCECGMLFKSDTHFTSDKHLAWIKAKELVETVESEPVHLEPESMPVPVEPEPVELVPVEPEPVEAKSVPVYQVEIKGIIYLNKDNVLYDAKTYKKVGSIGTSGFIIGTKVIPIKTKKTLRLHPDLDNKWIDDEQIIYIKVNNNVAHAIGLMENDELKVWD